MKIIIVFLVIQITVLSSNITAQNFMPIGPGLMATPNHLLYDSLSNLLYAGGNFSQLGDGQPMNKISAWNGLTWDSLGSGINDQGRVLAMTFYNGDLIVGGTFNQIGGISAIGLARWDGQTWHHFADAPSLAGFGGVLTLCTKGNDLYVGGIFETIDGLPANSLAKYDGLTWTTFPSLGPFQPSLETVIIYNNELYIGGNFQIGPGIMDIAKFDGSQWVSVGGGLIGGNDAVNDFQIYQNKLVVGGYFHVADGDPGNGVALWDGTSWTQLGAGVLPGSIFQCHVFQNDLYVGGLINDAGGIPVTYIAKWDSSNWMSLNSIFGNAVLCFESMGNDLIIGGFFKTIDNDSILHITKYNNPVGIFENSITQNFIQFLPNPATDYLNIKYDNNCNRIINISITDILNRPYKNILLPINQRQLRMDISEWPSGVYLYTLFDCQNNLISGIFVIN